MSDVVGADSEEFLGPLRAALASGPVLVETAYSRMGCVSDVWLVRREINLVALMSLRRSGWRRAALVSWVPAPAPLYDGPPAREALAALWDAPPGAELLAWYGDGLEGPLCLGRIDRGDWLEQLLHARSTDSDRAMLLVEPDSLRQSQSGAAVVPDDDGAVRPGAY